MPKAKLKSKMTSNRPAQRRLRVQRSVMPPVETFDDSQVECAIRQFLDWGEQEYGKAQQGYFSGNGWAARCLRYHLQQLKARRHNAGTQRPGSSGAVIATEAAQPGSLK